METKGGGSQVQDYPGQLSEPLPHTVKIKAGYIPMLKCLSGIMKPYNQPLVLGMRKGVKVELFYF